jgi:serine protease Do
MKTRRTFWIAAMAGLTLVGCQRDASRRLPWEKVPEPEAEKAAVPAPDPRPPLPPGKYGEFQQIFADVAEGALPGVVSIHSEKQAPGSGVAPFGDMFEGSPFEYFFGAPSPQNPRRESGLGSGVIIDSDGTIVTNNHVIEGADRIRVQLHDGHEYEAEIVGADKPSDLAVIRLRGGKNGCPSIPLGNSDQLRIGEWVIAVGSPYGLSQTVTTGIISAKGRHNTGINSYEDFLQTDAAINPGNSGGALLNLRGELVGINTAIFSRSGGYQGIGFAIPINMVRRISVDLVRDGEVTRGWLGVSIQPLDPELAKALGVKDRNGALVGGVVPGSPAGKAGLQRGDVITRVDGKIIKDPNDLLNHIALQSPDAWVEVRVNRDGQELPFKVKIARRDEKRMASFQKLEEEGVSKLETLGLGLEDVSPRTRREYGIDPALVHGAVVTEVAPGSRASRARLQVGDVIVEVNRVKVRNVAEVRESLGKGSKGNRILLLIHRGGNTFFSTL